MKEDQKTSCQGNRCHSSVGLVWFGWVPFWGKGHTLNRYLQHLTFEGSVTAKAVQIFVSAAKRVLKSFRKAVSHFSTEGRFWEHIKDWADKCMFTLGPQHTD